MQFSEKKAAQVAAFFLYQAGGRLEILKLMKLMYLAERESYRRFGEPMIGDKLVSMDNGPVLSITLNHVNRFLPSEPDGWEAWVSDRNDYFLALRKAIKDPKEDLLQLSDAELEVLDSIWREYGRYGSFQLADLTHDICPEWEDPHGSSLPISQSRLLRSLGFDPQTAKALEERIEANRHIDLAFSRRQSADFPAYAPQSCILVSFSTVRGPHDTTRTVQAGAHPFIKEPSFVAYRQARMERSAVLADRVASGTHIAREPADETLRLDLIAGLYASPLTPRYLKNLAIA